MPWSAPYPATSCSVQVARGLILTMPQFSSKDTIGASRRVGASTRLRPVIQASLPSMACFMGRTLRNSQHWAVPHGHSSAPATGLVTVRLRS